MTTAICGQERTVIFPRRELVFCLKEPGHSGPHQAEFEDGRFRYVFWRNGPAACPVKT